jgi:hypothetical protein
MTTFSRRSVRLLALAVPLVAMTASAGAYAVQPAATAAAAVPAPCRANQLTVWQGIPGDGAAGSTYYELEFSNTSRHACTLRGYPTVVAVNSRGTRLGRVSGHDPFFARRTVTLASGATAHAVLRLTDVSVFSPAACRPVMSAGLRIYAPSTTTSTVIPERLPVCSSRSGPTYLFVRVVRPGVGVPGVSQ